MATGIEAIVKFPSGRFERGLALSIERDRMRVAFPGFPDVIELRSRSGLWVSDSGEPFEVEGLVACCSGRTAMPGGLLEGDSPGISGSQHSS
jgi:hypothetical protein